MSHTKSMFKGLHVYSSYNGDLCSATSRVRSLIRDTVGGRSLQEWLYWAVDNNNIEAVTYLLNSGVLVGDCYMLLIRAMETPTSVANRAILGSYWSSQFISLDSAR